MNNTRFKSMLLRLQTRVISFFLVIFICVSTGGVFPSSGMQDDEMLDVSVDPAMEAELTQCAGNREQADLEQNAQDMQVQAISWSAAAEAGDRNTGNQTEQAANTGNGTAQEYAGASGNGADTSAYVDTEYVRTDGASGTEYDADAVVKLISYEVPEAENGRKVFEDYGCLTARSSKQYALQQEAWTDSYGFRRYGDLYMVAMGTYYATQCGKIFRITLDTGCYFDAIVGDIKADVHTDARNQHRQGNVVEFIVDSSRVPEMALLMGDMSYALPEMEGCISSIQEISS